MGRLAKFILSWDEWHGRGDFLTNILLYLPLGFFAALSFSFRTGPGRRIASTIAGGAALSMTIELIQYYDAGRTTAAVDFYWNTIGTALGAVAGSILAADCRSPALRAFWANPVPTLLLATWLASRLSSYLPASPSLSARELLLDFATWLTAGALLGAVVGQHWFRSIYPLLALSALALQGVIAGTVSLPDTLGSAAAFAWLFRFGGARRYAIVVALVLAAAALDQTLSPPPLRVAAGGFGWMPFAGYMKGSERDIVSFLQKAFLYGGLIWLGTEAGLRLLWSAMLIAAALFAADWAAVLLLRRPGDVSDCVIALLIAADNGRAVPAPGGPSGRN